MKKALLTIPLILLSFSLSAQLSDRQVVDYVKQAREQGMGQSEIAAYLAQKGVTQEQLLRIRAAVSSSGEGASSVTAETDDSRLRIDPRSIGIENLLPPSVDSTTTDEIVEAKDRIFGHNIFTRKQLTFEPSLNIATPDNYTLGPGDEVIIDIWGDSEQTLRQRISPDGTIVVNRLGPISLNGLTVKEAGTRLQRSFSRIYSSVDGERPATFIKLTLGQIRSIQINVMGEVVNPGTYTVSSLASLFHILYNAGGVNEIGSLRGIGVNRGGTQIATVDVYSYLLEGKTEVNIALRDGDVVIVPPYDNLVSIEGSVKRPMWYEMKEGETVETLLGFAGGFMGESYKEAVTVVRRSERLGQVYNVGKSEYSGFALADGDVVTVGGAIERFENRIEITGAVFRPGFYAISENVTTVKQLIERAEGFRGDAFTGRGVLTREKPDYTLEVLSLDVGAIMLGSAPDVELRNEDVLYIPSLFDLREAYTVTIQGAVRTPGKYDFAENLSIEDMIVKAGGLLESASTVKVDVYRRIKDPRSIAESSVRAESFSFPVRGGLVVLGDNQFTLQPFDVVEVRTSPGYEPQKSVTVRGEVLFPGGYTIVEKEERISDLLARSGGTLSKAYLRGASLTRLMDDDEKVRVQALMGLAGMGGTTDSLSVASLGVSDSYRVGIELDKALAYPDSDYDLILKEGDVLTVPEYVGTVSIRGAVLFPNTVSYREGMSVRDYINQAGGYANRARRGAKIVVYMNGTVSRMGLSRRAKIEPGCEIVVPFKKANNNRMTFPEILSLGLSTTSTAAMVTNLINSMK